MANTMAVCTSFVEEEARGIHDLSSDVIMAALYYQTASLSASTTGYTPTGEVAAIGYPPGGVIVPSAVPPMSSGMTTYWTPSDNVEWDPFVTGSLFDAALLYNASKGNRAIGVWMFPATTLAGGPFILVPPVNAPGTAVLQWTRV